MKREIEIPSRVLVFVLTANYEHIDLLSLANLGHEVANPDRRRCRDGAAETALPRRRCRDGAAEAGLDPPLAFNYMHRAIKRVRLASPGWMCVGKIPPSALARSLVTALDVCA